MLQVCSNKVKIGNNHVIQTCLELMLQKTWFPKERKVPDVEVWGFSRQSVMSAITSVLWQCQVSCDAKLYRLLPLPGRNQSWNMPLARKCLFVAWYQPGTIVRKERWKTLLGWPNYFGTSPEPVQKGLSGSEPVWNQTEIHKLDAFLWAPYLE